VREPALPIDDVSGRPGELGCNAPDGVEVLRGLRVRILQGALQSACDASYAQRG
jgi:hypothetical protein